MMHSTQLTFYEINSSGSLTRIDLRSPEHQMDTYSIEFKAVFFFSNKLIETNKV